MGYLQKNEIKLAKRTPTPLYMYEPLSGNPGSSPNKLPDSSNTRPFLLLWDIYVPLVQQVD